MKAYYFLLIFQVIAVTSFGQSNNFSLPQLIPPSPTAQAFMRYGEIPVDYSTGVPNISIPLLTISGKKLEVPVSISYHASGIKVNDIASEVGLGWTLNCGGMVSRTVNGLRDEANSVISTYGNATQLLNALVAAADQGYSNGCFNGIRDFEYFLTQTFLYSEDYMSDRYFYRLPNGSSGVFTYDYSNENNFVTLPYKPVKIDKAVNNNKIEEFKITDENGTIFTFKPYISFMAATYSEWYLTEMRSADNTDIINFNYVLQPANYTISYSSYTYLGPKVSTSSSCYPDNILSANAESVTPSAQFGTPVLGSITSATSIVQFYYEGREDFNGLQRLREITVAPINAPANFTKRIQFNESYFGSTNADKRLRLDNLVINSPASTAPQTYSFIYESQSLPSYPFNFPATFPEDYWGYYNGNGSNQVPKDFISNSYDKQAFGATREAGGNWFSKACMLKEIRYPTGGKNVFAFERYFNANAYPYKNDPVERGGYIGGFRVASITSYSDNGTVAGKKSYEYELPVTKQISANDFSYNQIFVERKDIPSPGGGIPDTWCWAKYTRDIVGASPFLPNEVAPGMPIMYQKVTEYNGTSISNAGKTVYTYNAPYSPSDYLNNPEHPVEFEQPRFYHPYHYDKGNYVPELVSKTVYSFDGTTYRPVLKEEYEYEKNFEKTFNTGIKMSRLVQFPSVDYWCYPCTLSPTQCAAIAIELIAEYKASVVAIDTKAYQEASLLTRSKSYVYDPADDSKYILTSTEYAYNEQNLSIKESTILSSKSDLIKNVYKYPHDFPGTEPYATMVSRNILTPVVEEVNYKNTSILKSLRNEYGFWSGTAWSSTSTPMVLPKNIWSKVATQTQEELRLKYSYDTRGNISEASKNMDITHLYLWGYNGKYPVAEVIGSNYAAVSSIVTQNQIDIATGVNSNDNNVRTLLNGLRTGLPGAMVKTFTYKPLVGVTSETDPSGKTTYYEYDAMGRLSLIRDQNNAILSKICYNYEGQVIDCNGVSNGNWQPTNITRCKPCEENPTYAHPIKQIQLKDIDNSSPTYNQLTWKDDADMSSVEYYQCLQNGWQNTSTPPVCQQEMGYNTGIQLQEQRNLNPCSPFYNQTQWIAISNTASCPLPAVYNSQDLSGYFSSQVCTGNYVSTPVYVSVPAGMFTSTVSVGAANQLAYQYAQNIANQQGVCYLPTINLPIENFNASKTFQVVIRNTQNITVATATVGPGGSQTLSLPAGTYNIRIPGSGSGVYYYEIGIYTGSQESAFTLDINNVDLVNGSTIYFF